MLKHVIQWVRQIHIMIQHVLKVVLGVMQAGKQIVDFVGKLKMLFFF
jgi:hypothetical protein